MDQEHGRKPRVKNGKTVEDIVRFEIKPAGRVRLASLQAYLSRQADFNEECLKSINFLDHLLRETPSKKLINLRRSYFVPREQVGKQMMTIGGGVEALKGIYQSIRMAEGAKLVINADVSNSCFWNRTSFDRLCFHMVNCSERDFEGKTRWYKNMEEAPNWWAIFKRLAKSTFYVKHPGIAGKPVVTKRVMSIVDKSADMQSFEWNNKETGVKKTVTVTEYFLQRYKIRLEKPYLPLVQVREKEYYPMEFCCMLEGNRYPAKLSEAQTSAMIKFAATRPQQRKESIRYGLDNLGWSQDPYLAKYGLKINPNMLSTNARVLEPPEVKFKNGVAKPGFSGRWDLKNKVFIAPGPKPLNSWGVLVLTGSGGGEKAMVPSKDQVNHFIQQFVKIYKGHGGIVHNTNPVLTGGVSDAAKAVLAAFQAAGNQANARPQLIMVILSNKKAEIYNRVKMSLDCRFGVVSQCVQSQQIMKANPQYCSNVALKFNNKLGGTNSVIQPKASYFKEPTMIIGADVSHGAPGTKAPSIAALTMSVDRYCARYIAGVQVNGRRIEMITPENIDKLVGPMIQNWCETVGQGRLPRHVLYFRDGVSEGQYIPLIKQELGDLKKMFMEKTGENPALMPKFTVIVVEKRHHIRFFPEKGPACDKNGNPVPGTIVDKSVTHPFEDDWYLCSHAAIQGTARPTHYHVLYDEYGVPTDLLQKLVYEHCYQYQRATSPVSIFPAVYYAHLAAARAVSHINDGMQSQFERMEYERELRKRRDPTAISEEPTAPPPLRPMDPTNRIEFSMWYI